MNKRNCWRVLVLLPPGAPTGCSVGEDMVHSWQVKESRPDKVTLLCGDNENKRPPQPPSPPLSALNSRWTLCDSFPPPAGAHDASCHECVLEQTGPGEHLPSRVMWCHHSHDVGLPGFPERINHLLYWWRSRLNYDSLSLTVLSWLILNNKIWNK